MFLPVRTSLNASSVSVQDKEPLTHAETKTYKQPIVKLMNSLLSQGHAS